MSVGYLKNLIPLASIAQKESTSYEKNLKDDLGQLINALEVSELHKHSLRSRWLDQVLWTEKKASQCQRWYYTLRLAAIIGGLIVPALVSLNLSGVQFSGVGFVQGTAFGLSMIV